MDLLHQWQYHCSSAELTPDLVTHIRNFPVRKLLLKQDLFGTLHFASPLMVFAEFIPSLVCAL